MEQIIKMEKDKKPRKLKKLNLDLPKISNNALTFRNSEKQNLDNALNCHLSPKIKDLRKLFFQYRSNARILEKSPYYNNNTKNRKKLVEMISTRRYDITDEIQKEIFDKYGWIEQYKTNEFIVKDKNSKKEIKIKLVYENRTYPFIIQCSTCEQLTKKVTCELAKIMFSSKNTYKKCDFLLCYQTTDQNHEIDFILSNPSLNIKFLDKLSLQPVFVKNLSHNKKVSISDFKFVKCLGNGGFSTVYLVKSNFDNKYYALKLIDKKFIIDSQRDGIVQNQRYILGQLKSPFVTQLEFCFQTKNHFVLVVQYCPGGQLFYQLKRVKRMKEEQAKFYFLEILIGLDYIHQKNIIYRDLKPQNLLISIDGHIKIADFGLSKPLDNRKDLSHSFCGSPEYMAPQMLLKVGHNYLLDYYCLGALLYELVVGVPPYYSLDHEEIYNSILSQQLGFPSYVQLSDDLKKLLQGLLQKNPKKRLGCMFGVKEILLHPWIGKIKQKSIENKELRPPFLPNLQSFNFDLGDIKTDQQAINKKIEDDMISSEFETHFSEQFYFQTTQLRERLQKFTKKLQKGSSRQKKLLAKSKSMQNYLSMSHRAESQSNFSVSKSGNNYLTTRHSKLRKVNSTKNTFASAVRK